MNFFTPPLVPTTPPGVPIPYPNLARGSRAGSQILFFDEADSLFGKREPVR